MVPWRGKSPNIPQLPRRSPTPPTRCPRIRNLHFSLRFIPPLRGTSTIAGHLHHLEVHITDWTGTRQFSSTEFPQRYDTRRVQTRRDFRTAMDEELPRIGLTPGAGTAGEQIVMALWYPTAAGVTILEIRETAFREITNVRAASRMFLVDRSQYHVFGFSVPREEANFRHHPALAIAFTDSTVLMPERDLLVHREDIPGSSLTWVMATDLSSLFDILRALLVAGLVVMAGALVITMAASWRVSRSLSAPIHDLVEAMSRDPRGPLPVNVSPPGRIAGELDRLADHYNRMVTTIQDLVETVRQEEQAHRLAERRALEAQIQPHFLYNTLGSIKSMAKLGDTTAVISMVTDLGKILRFLLDDSASMVTIQESVAQIRRYLNIQQIRFQDRLHVEVYVDDDARTLLIPKLLIQPLVENAILHGVERSTAPVHVSLAAQFHPGGDADDPAVEITVTDNGTAPWDASETRRGIGLRNVRERLDLVYGGAARIGLTRTAGVTTAHIRIPVP